MKFFHHATGKYLKYAIGEIFLVMIGILLAIRVNNWNETRKDLQKEKVILKELHTDFTNNLERFKPIKQNQLNTYNSGNIVFRNIDKMDIPVCRDSVYKYITGMFGGYPYHPSNGVVESLISSGDFKLIRNDTLRKYLVSWNDVLTHYTEYVAIDLQLWTNLIEPYVIHHGDFKNVRSPKNFKLVDDPVFINMLVRKQHFNRNIVYSIE